MASKTRVPSVDTGEKRVTLNGRVIAYRVRRSTRARWIRLEIRPDSGLIVVVPKACGTGCVPRILKGKADWVLRTLARYDGAPRRPAWAEIRSGDAVPYLGRRLIVQAETGRGESDCVRLERNRLMASLSGAGRKLDLVLEQWYRARATELMSAKVAEWSRRLGVMPRATAIRGQRTRWGSCSCKGSLSFNWRLMMVPEAVIDYVVIHELAHLKEMNHSKRFWQLVARHCPEWRELRQWLKAHEADLAAGLSACPRTPG